MTVGGDRIDYPGDCGTSAADLLTVKLLFNSVISSTNAEFMTLDIKHFYLNNPLTRYQYIRLKMADLPETFMKENKISNKVTNNSYVYVGFRKVMYGLPRSVLIAQYILKEQLHKHGYRESKYTPSFWTHAFRTISSSFVFDEFGVNYVGKENAEHLIKVLEEHYTLNKDWSE